MPPEMSVVADEPIQRSTSTVEAPPKLPEFDDSLFEHVAWLYAFCRERLFRDDTERIVTALWPNGGALPGTQLIELGCGPGFYSAQLAKRFPNIFVTGVDRSENQLTWARERAVAQGLRNCSFARVNVLNLPFRDGQFDVLIASRLFTILPDRERAVAEMHRVLKPGGRCFIAEPRYAVWASIPATDIASREKLPCFPPSHSRESSPHSRCDGSRSGRTVGINTRSAKRIDAGNRRAA